MAEDINKNTTQDQVQEPQKEEETVEETTEEVVEEATEENPVEEEETETVEDTTPDFKSGDTVKVHYKIIEGTKTRIQPYEGIVIAKKGKGTSKTFTVRKIGVDHVGVERIFPLYSPNIEKIEVKKRGKVRKAKLYYLRNKKGREAMRIRELGK